MFYAGIGSRETPGDILLLMTRIAKSMRRTGLVLRSGHATGADQAFELGAEAAAHIYLPWKSFEMECRIYPGAHIVESPSREAYEIAAQYHPSWTLLRSGARALHARNVHQVLGLDLQTRAAGVICWTPNGSLDGSERGTGGTGQALRIAYAYAIPVFNLARPEHLSWAYSLI